MPRLVVSVNHEYSAKKREPKFGPTGRRIRDVEWLFQDNEPQRVFADKRNLKWMAAAVLSAALVLCLAWWRVFHFPH